MKILLLDIERSPNLGYIWGKYEQNVLAFKKEGYLLSFAYKWLDKKLTHAHALPDYPLYKKDRENDRELAWELWKVLEEADIVVAHNGDNFDIKIANALFVGHGFVPPSPFRTVDTLKVARRYFKFNSNKLDDLGAYLGLGEKTETGGFKLWSECMAGDKKAWRLMVKYNKQDITLLEGVYYRLLPWMTHPNLLGNDACPNCGSHRVQKRGIHRTISCAKQKYQCQECGKWSLGKLTDKPQILR